MSHKNPVVAKTEVSTRVRPSRRTLWMGLGGIGLFALVAGAGMAWRAGILHPHGLESVTAKIAPPQSLEQLQKQVAASPKDTQARLALGHAQPRTHPQLALGPVGKEGRVAPVSYTHLTLPTNREV